MEAKQEYWKGYLYMVLLGMTSVMVALTDTRYWNSMELLSMRVYTAITATIYKKSLTLSSSGRNEYTAGEVVNLMAVDAEKVKESVKFITFLWSAPLQVGLTIYFIWQIIGPSVLVGKKIKSLKYPSYLCSISQVWLYWFSACLLMGTPGTRWKHTRRSR